MKRTTAAFLTLIFLLAILPDAYADQSQQNAVCELYSVDGYYEDDVGNQDTYSYHVPQINADTPAAKEINTEIAEHFGKRVEHEFQNMEGSFSLVSWHTGWHAYWSGSQLFLLITSDNNGDMMEYGAYGYDFETGNRVTNEMILAQKGISEEEYMEQLREAVSSLFEELYIPIPEGVETNLSHDSLLEDTLGWLSADQPIFLNQFGEIETWAAIAVPAGAGRYDHLVTLSSLSPEATYAIRVTGDTDLVQSCPEFAKAGEIVTVLTYDVTDGDKEIRVRGADGEEINWFEYRFVMPDHDVEVQVEFISNGLA